MRPICLWFVLLALASARPALAGGGPERTLLVVNARSPLSRTLGNAYRARRGIPDRHVLYLDSVPGSAYSGQWGMPLALAQETILAPVLEYLDAQRLLPEVDTIVFSSGFPVVINVSDKHPTVALPSASLTGCMYFAHAVFRENTDWMEYFANAYFRGGLPLEGKSTQPLTPEQQALSDAGKKQYYEKQYGASVRSFQELLKTYRNDGNVWYNLACSQALLGLRDQAMDSLEMAVANGFSDSFWARYDRDLDGLRGSSRYRDLLAVMRSREPVRHGSHAFHNAAVWEAGQPPQVLPT